MPVKECIRQVAWIVVPSKGLVCRAWEPVRRGGLGHTRNTQGLGSWQSMADETRYDAQSRFIRVSMESGTVPQRCPAHLLLSMAESLQIPTTMRRQQQLLLRPAASLRAQKTNQTKCMTLCAGPVVVANHM